jgi:hypothetical protein
MSDIVKRLEDMFFRFGTERPDDAANRRIQTAKDAADEIKKLRAALKQARRDALEEAARRVEIMWLMFREKDNGASDWIFRAHDDIPTGDDFATSIRALGEKE